MFAMANHVGVCRLEVPTGLDRIGEAVALIESDLAAGYAVRGERILCRISILRLSLFRDVAAFGAVIAQIGGRRTWTALLFLILGSLTEGISILLLVPLLHLVGRADQDFAVRLPDNDFVRWLVPDGTLQLTTVLCAAGRAGRAAGGVQPLQVRLHGQAAASISSTACA